MRIVHCYNPFNCHRRYCHLLLSFYLPSIDNDLLPSPQTHMFWPLDPRLSILLPFSHSDSLPHPEFGSANSPGMTSRGIGNW